MISCLIQASWAGTPLATATSARSIALGNAFIGLANDSSALFTNPAGLADINDKTFTSLYAQPASNTNFTSLGGNLAGFGLGYRGRTKGNVSVSTEVVDVIDQELVLAYAKKIHRDFSLGGDLRLISKGMSKIVPGYEWYNASGSLLDLGLKYSPNSWLGLGLVAQNLGGQLRYQDGTVESFAVNFILGGSFQYSRELTINLDLNKEGGSPLLLHLGLEWWPVKFFALRAGLDQTTKSLTEPYNNLTAGLGLKVSGITIDYALYKQGDSTGDTTHYFSLGYVGPDAPATVGSKPLELKHFSDVPAGYWAKQPIEYLTTMGLLNWYPDGTFRPEQPISRAETVTLLVNAKDYPQPKEKTQVFPDVPLSFWAAGAIQTAYENKLTIGYPDGTFRPRNNTSRAEAITFLARFEKLSLKSAGEKPFTDLPKTHWAIREVLAAEEDGLLNYLKDNPFLPSQSLTRAELAEVLYRTKFIQKML